MLRRFSVLIFLFFAITAVEAQEFSPFTRYGLGYMRSDVFPATQGMGGISTPYSSFSHINHNNPASYADIGVTTFEIGANLNLMTVTTGNDSVYNGGNGSVGHIAIGLPLIRGKWGLAVGMLPYSNTNYNFTQIGTDTSRSYTGKGSLYQFFVGTGYRYKAISFGVNVGYVFGRMSYSRAFEFTDSLNAVNLRNTTDYHVNGFIYNLGVQYHYTLKHKSNQNHLHGDINLVAGIQGSGGIKLNSRQVTLWERYNYIYDANGIAQAIPIDTPNKPNGIDSLQPISATNPVKPTKGSVAIPFDFSAGVLFGNESWWMLGLDFRYTAWSKFSYDLNSDPMGDSWRLMIGGAITPNVDSKKYLPHLQFRAGGYYGKSQIIDQGSHLSEYGGTLGLGFPIFINPIYREAATFHINADIGARTPSAIHQLSENYYRISFGFTLNNVWFVKRKFD